jgi:hypothetical protein
MLLRISAAILDIIRHLESNKNFLSVKYVRLIYKIRIECKHVQNSVILKISATLKTCEKNFPIFYKPFYAFDRFKLRDVYFSL